MCTQADHVEPVAANTQPTTAVVAAKPYIVVYNTNDGQWTEYQRYNDLTTAASMALTLGIAYKRVGYYFNGINPKPTHKRQHMQTDVTEVLSDDPIFQQSFMKAPIPWSVVVYDQNNLTKAIRSTDFTNEKDAKRVLGKLIKPTEVTYMYAGGVPVKKRFRGEDSVQIVANDPIWNANVVKPVPVATTAPKLEARYYKKDDLKVPTKTSIVDKLGDYDYPSSSGNNGVNGNQIVYIFENDKPIKKRGYFESFVNVSSTDPIWEALKIKPEPKAQIEIRVYSQNDLNKILSSKIVESFDELEWRKTPMSNDQIGYAFVDGKPVKSRKGNMETKDVLSLDPIWETLKPKAGQMVAKVFKKNNLVNPLRTININKPEDTHSVTGTSIYGDEVIYVFTDGVATHIRAFGRDVKAIPTNDPIFANGIPVQTKESVVSITPAVDTEKPVTLQEFLKELMKSHEDKQRTYFDYAIFKELLQKFWPEKVAYCSDNKSALTTDIYRMFDVLNNWNPPAKKKYKFNINKLRHNFIIEAARLANTSNPSDKFVESLESFGKAASMFVGNWQSDIRVVLAKHFNNPLWLKNGVFTVNNESYELEQIDMVIT